MDGYKSKSAEPIYGDLVIGIIRAGDRTTDGFLVAGVGSRVTDSGYGQVRWSGVSVLSESVDRGTVSGSVLGSGSGLMLVH